MAEENQGSILDKAKDMLGDSNSLLDKAKDMIGDKAGELLENADELKKKAVELGKSITPDSLDDKVEGAVDAAVDFLRGALGKNDKKE